MILITFFTEFNHFIWCISVGFAQYLFLPFSYFLNFDNRRFQQEKIQTNYPSIIYQFFDPTPSFIKMNHTDLTKVDMTNS